MGILTGGKLPASYESELDWIRFEWPTCNEVGQQTSSESDESRSPACIGWNEIPRNVTNSGNQNLGISKKTPIQLETNRAATHATFPAMVRLTM